MNAPYEPELQYSALAVWDDRRSVVARWWWWLDSRRFKRSSWRWLRVDGCNLWEEVGYCWLWSAVEEGWLILPSQALDGGLAELCLLLNADGGHTELAGSDKG